MSHVKFSICEMLGLQVTSMQTKNNCIIPQRNASLTSMHDVNLFHIISKKGNNANVKIS